MNVNILKDGNRTFVIIEGAPEERDELVYKVVQAYVAPPKIAEQIKEETPDVQEPSPDVIVDEVKYLEPVKISEPSIPSEKELSEMATYLPPSLMKTITVSFGKYKGMTPTAALRKDHEVALVEFFKSIVKAKISPEERMAIVKACKSYMRRLPDELYLLDNKAKQMSFIRTTSQMVNMDAVLKRFGFNSIEALERQATDQKVAETVNVIAGIIRQRGNTSK